MFTHMVPVSKQAHRARDTEYEMLVYRVEETGEYRIFISKGGFGVGDVFVASQDVVTDSQQTGRDDVVAELIRIARDDIDRNEFGLY